MFTVKNSDLKKFTQEAKKYGVLYNVLADRKTQDPNAPVDIIARAEDAAKISRIMERFHLSSVDVASVVAEAEKSRDNRAAEQTAQTKQPETPMEQKRQQDKEALISALFGEPKQEETENPFLKAIKNDPLSAPSSANPRDSIADEGTKRKVRKPSVRAELREIKAQRKKQEERQPPVLEPNRKQQNQKPITHQQPVRKPRNRPRGR